jgi:hypothetical protein
MPRTHATVAISLHPDLREEARQRAQELGFGNSFSAYVARLIAEDVRKADTLRDAPPTAEQLAAQAIAHARDTAAAPVSYAPPAKKRARKPPVA